MKTDDDKLIPTTIEAKLEPTSQALSQPEPPTSSPKSTGNLRVVVITVIAAVLILAVVIASLLLNSDKPAPTPTASNPSPKPNPTSTPALHPTPTPELHPTPTPELPGWKLIWSDEFNGPAGTPPNPAVWGHEIGDGTANGNKGWGNNELEYYTDSPDNAALDGAGNLVITARQVNTATNTMTCYYGPCQYTSARLLTANKIDFQYGRIEARIKVPGGVGMWPAFWALGSNISQVSWPKSGEIDIMENIGRSPNRLFGTIHGPGYSGAGGISKAITLPQPLASAFHTYAIEWQPDKVVWYFDDQAYHIVTPSSIGANHWVFNQPFFLLLNVAVGGNLGGQVPVNTTFPQIMTVDYVRHYQSITAPTGATPAPTKTSP